MSTNNQQPNETSAWQGELNEDDTTNFIKCIPALVLKKLYLRHCDINKESVSILSTCSQLGSLKLINCNVKTNSLINLTNALIKDGSPLRKLCIKYDNILSTGAVYLANALRNNNSLRELSVASSDLTTDASEILAEALYENSVLQKFNIKENTVCNTGASIFAKILVSSNTGLLHINLSDTGITHSGMIEIFEALAKNSTLQTLLLNSNETHTFFNKVLVSAANALEINNSLTSLELGNCNKQSIDINVGLEKLLQVLSTSTSTTLQKLKLSSNNIDDVGAKSIASLLEKNHSLTKLDLRHNMIGEDGAIAIASVLTNTNSTLSALYLGENYIGTDAAIAFVSVLQSNTTLQQLKLNSCKIGQNGADAIANALCVNIGLKKISLKDNKIDKADTFCTLIKTNETLQTINLWQNNLTSQLSALENAIQQNFVLTCLNVDHEDSESYYNISDMLKRNMDLNRIKRLKKVKVALHV
jgi:Ran GTPase-activating protein (RanGAP) involved in mRNA processing and transport